MNNNQSDGSHNASPFYHIAQLTVPSAVTNAVSAATTIFTAISTNRFFFIADKSNYALVLIAFLAIAARVVTASATAIVATTIAALRTSVSGV